MITSRGDHGRSSSPRPDDNDCLRLPATSSPRTRGAEKKESTDLRLSQPCPLYVTPSSISSFGRRLSSAHIAESKFLKNAGANRFSQSSASYPCPRSNQDTKRYRLKLLAPRGRCSMSAKMTAQLVTDALVMAIWRRGKPDALLHHSRCAGPLG